MPDCFHFLDEPYLVFGMEQRATDPRDGLALFGAVDAKVGLPNYIVLGTPRGLTLWGSWSTAMNEPASCIDVARQRPWPPYPGFDVAFGAPWPAPAKVYALDSQALHYAAHLSNQHERTYAVANLYVEQMKNPEIGDSEGMD